MTAGLALVAAGLTGTGTAGAATTAVSVAPGVTYRTYDLRTARGQTRLHVVTADLRDPRVTLDLLHPGTVASRAPVSRLTATARAVAALNGDFFHLGETQHPGVPATGAAVGPAIAGQRVLKAAVPDGQRFGPALPPGTSARAVLGLGADRRVRLDELRLRGTVGSLRGWATLGGLNQYALPVGSVGAFTGAWGSASRARAVCGSDTRRTAPCATQTHEVTLRRGRVVATSPSPGSGRIAADTIVLLGREDGARRLRRLEVGDVVRVRYELTGSAVRAYRFAVGGFPVLRDGRPLAGLDAAAAAVRSAVGVADGGRRVLLVASDGSPEYRGGLTLAELAGALRNLGATHGFNLDGGGSTTLTTRSGAGAVKVRNHPSAGAERAVPNAVGVFSGR